LSKLWLFYHNFLNRNVRKSIEDSTDLDYILVSTEDLSQKIGSCSWGPGLIDFFQKGLNLPHSQHHPQKPKILNFSIKKNPY